MQRYETSALIKNNPREVFDYVDDHTRFSSHMGSSSWMMGGGHMKVLMDPKHGREVGSHIQMKGKVFGIPVYLDEVITKREAPYMKTWETVGSPNLLVVGHYRMEIKIEPVEQGSILYISIDYDLPEKNAWLGSLFGSVYAKWCVGQMLDGTSRYFAK